MSELLLVGAALLANPAMLVALWWAIFARPARIAQKELSARVNKLSESIESMSLKGAMGDLDAKAALALMNLKEGQESQVLAHARRLSLPSSVALVDAKFSGGSARFLADRLQALRGG